MTPETALVVPFSPREITLRLRPAVRQGFNLSDVQQFELDRALDGSGASDLYQGELNVAGFRLSRRVLGRSLVRPLLVASFTQLEEGTSIAVRAVLDWKNTVALGLFVAVTPGILIQLSRAQVIRPELAIAASAAWIVIASILTRLTLRNAVGRLRKRLEILLPTTGVKQDEVEVR